MCNNLSISRYRWFYRSGNVDSNIDRNSLGVNLLVLKDNEYEYMYICTSEKKKVRPLGITNITFRHRENDVY